MPKDNYTHVVIPLDKLKSLRDAYEIEFSLMNSKYSPFNDADDEKLRTERIAGKYEILDLIIMDLEENIGWITEIPGKDGFHFQFQKGEEM